MGAPPFPDMNPANNWKIIQARGRSQPVEFWHRRTHPNRVDGTRYHLSSGHSEHSLSRHFIWFVINLVLLMGEVSLRSCPRTSERQELTYFISQTLVRPCLLPYASCLDDPFSMNCNSQSSNRAKLKSCMAFPQKSWCPPTRQGYRKLLTDFLEG